MIFLGSNRGSNRQKLPLDRERWSNFISPMSETRHYTKYLFIEFELQADDLRSSRTNTKFLLTKLLLPDTGLHS